MYPFYYIRVTTGNGKKGKFVTYIDKNGNMETREGGSRSWRNNNPGNLRGSFKSIGRDRDGFDIFSNIEHGRDAKIALIKRKYGNYNSIHEMLSGKFDPLGKFIYGTGYAPKMDGNDPDRYAIFIEEKTNLDVYNTPIRTLSLSQLDELVDAMKIQEGYIIGSCSITPIDGKYPRRPR